MHAAQSLPMKATLRKVRNKYVSGSYYVLGTVTVQWPAVKDHFPDEVYMVAHTYISQDNSE